VGPFKGKASDTVAWGEHGYFEIILGKESIRTDFFSYFILWGAKISNFMQRTRQDKIHK
jgi:hypothetical protein